MRLELLKIRALLVANRIVEHLGYCLESGQLSHVRVCRPLIVEKVSEALVSDLFIYPESENGFFK